METIWAFPLKILSTQHFKLNQAAAIVIKTDTTQDVFESYKISRVERLIFKINNETSCHEECTDMVVALQHRHPLTNKTQHDLIFFYTRGNEKDQHSTPS